jgi:hypothetical protein
MLTSDKLTQMKSNRSPAHDRDDLDATLAELRTDLASLVADVKQVVEARAARAKDAAEIGLDAARGTIRSYPVASLAVATLVGAAAAIALTSGSRQSRQTTRVGDWAQGIARADLQEMFGNLNRSATRMTTGTPLISAFERVVDTVSSMDPKASLTPALEKAGAWLSSLRGSIAGK